MSFTLYSVYNSFGMGCEYFTVSVVKLRNLLKEHGKYCCLPLAETKHFL